MMHTGSNILPIARFLQLTHTIQAFRGDDTTPSGIMQRSYMCAERIERDDKRTCKYSIVTEFYPGGSSGLFSSLRSGTGNLFKNIKDTSSKVIQSVQQTITRNDELDASYIKSRILVYAISSLWY
ncbi:hypothetical protein HCN44_004890 [Aphidius gifuensis]|uniref:Uncharacterized protein n=1 Tax=Aphidius gifuensis TaxID=684658 RepID=A0A834XTJ3_APHGI|nr:hypothetical protein HCN44_004890 [Aphidius gifuensis]